MRRQAIKIGDYVEWIDPVTKRGKRGVVKEVVNVVNELSLDDWKKGKDWKEVNEMEAIIVENNTHKKYGIEVGLLKVIDVVN